MEIEKIPQRVFKKTDGLGGCRRLFLFCFLRLAAFAQFGLLALLPPRGAFGRSDDINDDFSVVLAAHRACAVRDARGTTFAGCQTLACNSVVAAPHCGLGTILAHSDYHCRSITAEAPKIKLQAPDKF